jgi:hypothetical protein
MLSGGFKPAIPAKFRLQILTLDRSTRGIGFQILSNSNFTHASNIPLSWSHLRKDTVSFVIPVHPSIGQHGKSCLTMKEFL